MAVEKGLAVHLGRLARCRLPSGPYRRSQRSSRGDRARPRVSTELEPLVPPRWEVSKYRAPALEKGLDILRLLAGERTPMTVSTICQRLGRSQGEIFRMVQVLQTRGFVDQDPKSDGYYLTDLLFSMAMRQPATQGLVEIAIPVMRGLAAEIGQSCHLALHSRGEIVVVARMESMEQIGFSVRVGYRRSINMAVSGLTLLAFQPEDVHARWLEMIEPKPT